MATLGTLKSGHLYTVREVSCLIEVEYKINKEIRTLESGHLMEGGHIIEVEYKINKEIRTLESGHLIEGWPLNRGW